MSARIPKEWGPFEQFSSSLDPPLQAGQANANMALTLGTARAAEGIVAFADWTDRIAAGELPFAKPQRPQGIERNVVLSMWEWSTPKAYLHDAISTDKRNPRVNANGLVYGSPEESTDMVPVLNPITNTAYADQASLSRSRRRLPRKICRADARRIGATSRSGTATPASTTRSSTIKGGCGSPRASARRPTRIIARKIPIILRRRSCR